MSLHFFTILLTLGTWSFAVVSVLAVVMAIGISSALAKDRYEKNKDRLEAFEDYRLRNMVMPAGTAHIPPGTDMSWLYGIFYLGGTLALIFIVHDFLAKHDGLTKAVVGAWLVLIIAAGLFFLKVQHLWVYATVEVLFALYAAGQTLHDFHNDIPAADLPLAVVKLVGSVYVLIRGMDNWWKTPQIEPVKAQWREFVADWKKEHSKK